ncbi:MAG: hypothetical protein ACRDVP_05550 [Acidimicrobiales bacterium]
MPEMFGRLWSGMVARAAQATCRIPSDRILHLDYDALVSEPAVSLLRLADFLGLSRSAEWNTGESGSFIRQEEPDEYPGPLVNACLKGNSALRNWRGN